MVDYDLHIHTTASDGILTPGQVIEAAGAKKLKGISITDHDTVEAIESGILLGKASGLEVIPGIELSTEYYGSEVHMLGYYIDYKDEELINALNKLKAERLDRLNKMIIKLKALGYNISFNEILEAQGLNEDSRKNSFGRPHLARLLVSKGYFENMQEVFNKLIGEGMPCYVERFKFTAEEGINTVKRFKGVPVLAHPALIKNAGNKLEKIIAELKSYGLEGLEVYHTDQTMETSLYLSKLANKYGLLMTGGSDYHGPSTHKESNIGSKGVPAINADQLRSMHLKRLEHE